MEGGNISVRQGVSAIVGDAIPVFREAIVQVLARELSISVSHHGEHLAEILDLVIAKRPRLALIDRDLGDVGLIDTIALAVQRTRRTCFILTSVRFSGTDLLRAHNAGVNACLLKTDTSGELCRSIQDALNGRFVYSQKLQEQFNIRWDRKSHKLSLSGPLSELTKRELQVLTYIAHGFSTKEIAAMMAVSPKTVDRHKASVMLKLDTHDRVLLTHFAIREGLISPWNCG